MWLDFDGVYIHIESKLFSYRYNFWPLVTHFSCSTFAHSFHFIAWHFHSKSIGLDFAWICCACYAALFSCCDKCCDQSFFVSLERGLYFFLHKMMQKQQNDANWLVVAGLHCLIVYIHTSHKYTQALICMYFPSEQNNIIYHQLRLHIVHRST